MRFVDFEGLWKMAIDTPYSLLVSSGSSAWTCGQLAMDENAEVVAPGDLDRQAEIVADYIAEILRRADLTIEKARRLVLYYVGTEQAGASMRSVLKARFGDTVIFDPVPVPSLYYEGVILKMDIFSISAPRLEHDQKASTSGYQFSPRQRASRSPWNHTRQNATMDGERSSPVNP